MTNVILLTVDTHGKIVLKVAKTVIWVHDFEQFQDLNVSQSSQLLQSVIWHILAQLSHIACLGSLRPHIPYLFVSFWRFHIFKQLMKATH